MRTLLALVSLFLLAPALGTAQPMQSMTAGLTKVTVREQSGYVTFFALDDTRLTFDSKSFFSVKIEGKIYTNNDSPPPGTTPLPAATSKKSGDTIIVAWQVGGCNVVQIVEPVLTQLGEKPRIRYEVTNKNGSAVNVQIQYLLDVQMGGDDGGEYLTPDDGYNDKWRTYTQNIPSHLAYVGELRHFSGEEPLALLTLEDTLFGVDPPAMMMTAQWPQVERQAFVSPSMQLPPTQISDFAIVLQWDTTSIEPGETRQAAAFVYGAHDYLKCDELLVIAPRSYVHTKYGIEPKLTIPSYVINNTPSTLQARSYAMEAEGALSFENGAKSMSRGIPAVPAESAYPFMTTVTFDTLQTSGTLKFKNGCEATITLTFDIDDTLAPRIVRLDTMPSDCHARVDTLRIIDDEYKLDGGVMSADVVSNNYDFKHLLAPTYPLREQRIAFTVRDSMLDAVAIVTARDAGNNETQYTLRYCTTPDTMAPKVEVFASDAGWMLQLADNRAWDRELSKIDVTDYSNISVQGALIAGLPMATVSINITDITSHANFCYTVTDIAGNVTERECFEYNPQVDVREALISSMKVWPNPAQNELRINIALEAPLDAELRDILGGSVWKGNLHDGNNVISVEALPSGQYHLILGKSEQQALPVVISR